MATTITNNATATAYEIKDVTYLSADDKKVLGILGDVMLIDSEGNEVNMATIGRSTVGNSDCTYSNVFDDFTAVITDSTKTITITDLSYTLENIHVAAGLILKIANGTNIVTTVPVTNIVVDVGVITLADADDFVTGDIVVVFLLGPKKSYDADLDLQKTQEQSPLNEQYVEESIVDTTNVATGTYYPASTGMPFAAYKNLSLTGKLIDGAGETTTMIVEVTNDEDTASADWIQIYLYDVVNDITVNSVAATNETTLFALIFDSFNFRHLRIGITATAATNTIIIKMRRSY